MVEVDAAEVFDGFVHVELHQLQRRVGRALQGHDGGRIVRPGIAEGRVGRAHEVLRVVDGGVDELRDLRGDRRRIKDLRDVVDVAAVDADGRADAAVPARHARLVVDDLRERRGHERQHRHGEQLIDEDLVRDQLGNERLPVVAVLHVVPRHPRDRVELQARVLLLLDLHVFGALEAVDGAGLVVLPEIDDERAELILQGIHLVVIVFRVRADAVDIVLLHAVALGKALDLVHHETAGDDDIGLRLHAPVVRVAEDHARILDDLGDDVALRLLPGLDVRVKVGVGRAVAVDRRVAHELARQRHNLVPFKNSRKLLIHNVGDLLKIAERIHAGRAER